MGCLSHAESVKEQPWNNEIVLWIECIITFLPMMLWHWFLIY
jgi:hypothetical protein